jgi:hypothetical protein
VKNAVSVYQSAIGPDARGSAVIDFAGMHGMHGITEEAANCCFEEEASPVSPESLLSL